MKEETRAFWRELVAPAAARLALLPVARQLRSEGVSRDDFLTLATRAYDEAPPSRDEATQPSAPVPTEPPPRPETCGALHPHFDYLCTRERGHEGDHSDDHNNWMQRSHVET